LASHQCIVRARKSATARHSGSATSHATAIANVEADIRYHRFRRCPTVGHTSAGIKKKENELGPKIRLHNCTPYLYLRSIRLVGTYLPNSEYTDLLTYQRKASSVCLHPALVVLAHSAPSLLVGCIVITVLSAVSHIRGLSSPFAALSLLLNTLLRSSRAQHPRHPIFALPRPLPMGL
jgi:hypothetical protein